MIEGDLRELFSIKSVTDGDGQTVVVLPTLSRESQETSRFLKNIDSTKPRATAKAMTITTTVERLGTVDNFSLIT